MHPLPIKPVDVLSSLPPSSLPFYEELQKHAHSGGHSTPTKLRTSSLHSQRPHSAQMFTPRVQHKVQTSPYTGISATEVPSQRTANPYMRPKVRCNTQRLQSALVLARAEFDAPTEKSASTGASPSQRLSKTASRLFSARKRDEAKTSLFEVRPPEHAWLHSGPTAGDEILNQRGMRSVPSESHSKTKLTPREKRSENVDPNRGGGARANKRGIVIHEDVRGE